MKLNCREGTDIAIAIILVLVVFTTIEMSSENVEAAGEYSFYFTGGTGTENDPYQISDVGELQNMNLDLYAHYIIINDIDASDTINWNNGKGFEPIGNEGPYYRGSLNGNGYKISELYINRYSSNEPPIGLFCTIVSSGEVKNTTLVNINITGNSKVGGLVGFNYGGSILSSYTTGKVTGLNNEIGGLVGINNGEISRSYSICDVNGVNKIGGLVGYNYGSGCEISNSYANGNVSGSDSIGGLIGYNLGIPISNCYSAGDVSGVNLIGGLIGGGGGYYTILNCYWDIETSGTMDGIGHFDPDPSGVSGHISQDMMLKNTYVDWNFFNVWTIWEGKTYPLFSKFHINYIIKNVFDLQNVRYDYTGHYIIANNINASETRYWNGGKGFEPIGDYTNQFKGSLDGQGFNITNLFINRTSTDYIGLFGYIDNVGSIRNLTMSTTSISGNGYVGGLVGQNYGTITNSTTIGIIEGNGYAGGLVGYNFGTLSDSFFNGKIIGKIYVGGLTGSNCQLIKNSKALCNIEGMNYIGGVAGDNYGIITNSISIGNVVGNYNVGGFVGYNMHIIRGTFSEGEVSGNSNVGGLVGECNNGLISRSYAISNVSGTICIGGLVGKCNSGIIYSFATGKVEGSYRIGGLVGEITNHCTVNSCYSLGTVKGQDHVGGLIGYNYGGQILYSFSNERTSGGSYVGGLVGYNEGGSTIEKSYNTGSILGGIYSGGLVGYNRGTIEESYNTGSVRTGIGTGGLVGVNDGGHIRYSFWDNETSGITYSDGGMDKNTSDMMRMNTFTTDNWDFKYTWIMNEGKTYPILRFVFDMEKNNIINGNKMITYSKIQNAVDDADIDDTIFIGNDVYNENIMINKPLSLIGNNNQTSKIRGDGFGNGITIYSKSEVTINHLNIAEYQIAVRIEHSDNITMEGNIFNDCSLYGSYVLYSEDINIENNKIDNCSDIGSRFWVCERVDFENNKIKSCDMGIMISDTYSMNISGNTLDNTSMGIRAGRFSNVTISDNIIMNGLQNGIYLNQGGNATVFGNTITNQGHGLTVQKMEYVDINNNLFQNLSSGYTIRILDSNNTQFNDNLLTENNPQYWILDVQNSCNNTIKGNSFLDNPSLCIALTQKSNDNIIMNNYLLNNTNNIMLDSSDRNILRNNTMINGSFAITLGKSDHCIIENNTITGQDTGISISSSNNNTIKKNIITDNEVGIQLRYQDSKFNNITNNSVTYNTDRGIYLNDVSCTNYVSNNEICYNQYGLSLNKADNNEIFSNEISFNYYGIHFVDSDYNEIFDNSVHDNTYGMFYDPSNGNNIEDNTVKNNKYGIIIEESDSNTIINNIISENEIGIQIEDSDNNILIDNSISENDCGIQIDEGSTSNTIHHNSFIDNEVQAQDEGDSTWDDGEGEGNYWSDYIGSDGDNDGVGDNPYQSLDENPLMIPNQNAPPVADIGGPYYGYEGYETTFDASGSFDANSDPLKYRWDFNDDGIWDTGWSTDPTSTHKWTSDYSGYVVVEVSDGTLSDTDRTKILSMSPYQLKDDAASDLKAAKSGIGSIDKELDKIINNITASLGQKYWVDDSHLDPDNGSSIFTQDNVQISKMEALIVQYQNEILQLKKKIELYEIKGSDTTGLWSELKALEKAISALESAISKLVKSDELIVQTIIDENEGLEAGNSKYQKVVDNYLQKADEDMEDAKDDLDDGKINQALLHFKNAWEYIQKALEWADKE